MSFNIDHTIPVSISRKSQTYKYININKKSLIISKDNRNRRRANTQWLKAKGKEGKQRSNKHCTEN